MNELRVKMNLYLTMKKGETKEQAEDRMCKILMEMSNKYKGFSPSEFYNTEAQDIGDCDYHETIKTVGKHRIVRVYANAISEEGQEPYYGDIYNTKEEVKNEHPETEILTGYCILDETGYCADGTKDWYNTSKEAENSITVF